VLRRLRLFIVRYGYICLGLLTLFKCIATYDSLTKAKTYRPQWC